PASSANLDPTTIASLSLLDALPISPAIEAAVKLPDVRRAAGRREDGQARARLGHAVRAGEELAVGGDDAKLLACTYGMPEPCARDRKSTRLNSSHRTTSYAVFCFKKKKRTRSAACLRPSRHRSSRPRRVCRASTQSRAAVCRHDAPVSLSPDLR